MKYFSGCADFGFHKKLPRKTIESGKKYSRWNIYGCREKYTLLATCRRCSCVYAAMRCVSVVCARASVREKVRESMGETLPCGQIDLAPYSSSCQASLKCNTTEYCATVENLSNGAVSRRQQRWHVAHPFACVCVHSHPSPLVLDDHRTLLFISTHRTITSLDCRLSNERQ